MDNNDQKEGFLKRLKNIEGKNEELLDKIKDQKTTISGKASKAKNSLFYDTNRDFCRYRVYTYLKILSIKSKFDEFEPFYIKFVNLKNLDIKEDKIIFCVCMYKMVDISAETWNKAEVSLIQIHENDDVNKTVLLLLRIFDAKKR